MSTADTRGFQYPLQAVMLRRQWSIERIQGQMAAARSACGELQAEHDETSRACEAQADKARASWMQSPDPGAQQRMLGYLARLQEKQAGLQQRIGAAREEIQRLEQALTQEQIRLSALEEHRDGLREEYTLGQQRAAESQADAQWLTLSAWRNGKQGSGA